MFTRSSVLRRRAAVVALASLLAAACGGTDDDSADGSDTSATTATPTPTTVATPPATDTAETADEPTADPDDAEPIEGVLVSLLSPEFGLFDVARGTGEHRQLTVQGLGYTDRERQPILAVDGTAAYTLSYTPLEGQTFSHDVGLVAVDRATGQGRSVGKVGVDRTDDESQDLTTFEILGADAERVWVRSAPFAESDPALVDYTAYDVVSGATVASLTDVAQRQSDADGECTVGVSDVFVDSTGGLTGVSGGWPVAIDTTTGEVTPLVVGCLEFEAPSLASAVGTEGTSEFAVVRNDRPLAPETLESLAGITEISVAGGALVEGDGSLWWVFNRNVSTFVDDEQVDAIAGGVVRYDLTAQQIADVWPLGDAVGEWLAGDDAGSFTALSQPRLQYLDGSLWIMDHRDDRPLLRVDGSTGAVTEIEIPVGDGFDRITAELIANDPEAIWLDVTRWVTTETDDGGTSSSGTGFLDQVDVSTDTIAVSVDQSDIIGF